MNKKVAIAVVVAVVAVVVAVVVSSGSPDPVDIIASSRALKKAPFVRFPL